MSRKTVIILLLWALAILSPTGALLSCSGDDDDDEKPDVRVDDDDQADDDDIDVVEPPTASGPVRVMSFNVLCSFCDIANYDPWEERLAYFDDIFKRHQPDLIGTQELFTAQEAQQLLDLLPGFQMEFYHSDAMDYPDAALYYDAERFEALEWGVYWLSPTPEEPYSTGFAGGSQLARLVVWAHMRQKDGWEFYWANTHFDNNSPSQELSSPLFMERAQPWSLEIPVIATGDFNSKPDREAYHLLTEGGAPVGWALQNSFDLAPKITIDSNLDSRPDDLEPLGEWTPESRIDHIFVGGVGSWEASEWTVDTNIYGDAFRFPSDHRAISTEISWSR